MLETPQVRRQIPGLTGLRAVAALSVLMAHAWTVLNFSDWPKFQSFAIPLALFGMSLFFALSGYLMVWNYADTFDHQPFSIALREFAGARFARLYPLFLFFVVITLATTAVVSLPDLWPDLPWFIPLLQSWIPLGHHGLTVYGLPALAHTWSISTEFFFYVMFCPLILCLLARPPSAKAAAIRAGVWIFVAIGLLYAIYRLVPIDRLAPDLAPGKGMMWLAYLSPYTRIFEFILGGFACRFYRTVELRPVGRIEAVIGGATIILCLVWLVGEIDWAAPIGFYDFSTFADFLRLNFLNSPAIVILIFCVCRYDNWWSSAMSAAPLILIGEASYSIYLLHPFIVQFFIRGDQPLSLLSVLEWFGRMTICVLYVAAMGYGLYRIIEVPSRRWLRALLMARREKLAGSVRPA